MSDELKENINALEKLREATKELSYSRICEMTPLQKTEYDMLLEEFIRVHSLTADSPNAPQDLKAIKGRALEKISQHLLQVSGNIFTVISNLRTTTNEIDLVLGLSPTGQVLKSYNLINPRLTHFLGECKNYNKKVDVTYTGKFCSLLLTTQIKLGVLFSYYGITGIGWNDASGLVKKFYLHRENESDRQCIIDFNINDFIAVQKGSNFLDIVDSKLESLQFDTSFIKFLSKHPAEN